MPSDPSASSSSSSAKPSSSSSAKPSSSSSSSSAAKPSSSSSSSSRPSSSGSSSSSSSSSKPTQPTPYISANAWMSFFLFVCLVLIILQGPLGLSGMGMAMPSMSWGGYGGMPGCNGVVAAAVPWCQPVAPVTAVAPMAPVAQVMAMPQMVPQMGYAVTQPQVVVHQHQRYRHAPPQMGGQGYVASPHGGGGYSWYANTYPQGQAQPQAVRYHPQQPIAVQYQRQGMQVQVETGRQQASPRVQVQYSGPPEIIPTQAGVPVTPLPVGTPVLPGVANLESAFYPLLVGAIALLVIFDYAS